MLWVYHDHTYECGINQIHLHSTFNILDRCFLSKASFMKVYSTVYHISSYKWEKPHVLASILAVALKIFKTSVLAYKN